MKREVYLASVRLFNALPISSEKRSFQYDKDNLLVMLTNGVILDPSCPDLSAFNFLDVVEAAGISGERANKSLHKSWNKVKYASMTTLIAEQVLHYITTYGFNRLFSWTEGDENTVYIPAERLEVPAFAGEVGLIRIRGLCPSAITDRILKLASGVALHKDTLNDIMTLVEGLSLPLDGENLKQIKNKELRSKLYKFYGLVPDNPTDWLRYAVEKLTGSSLLIKDEATISALRMADPKAVDSLIAKAPARLGSIFNRFKPLFLAMKKASTNKRFFNRLRRDAKLMHRPMKTDFLSTVTESIARGRIDTIRLGEELARTNFFRKVRLLNALVYSGEYKAFRIRNGRTWVKKNDNAMNGFARSMAAATVNGSLKPHLKALEGQVVYIPEGIDYGVPTSEKSYVGNFPNGTMVSVPGDMTVGVYWKNVDGCQTDLDLSLLTNGTKIGWDARYRSSRRQVLFSGDITDAPNGATELFYISNQVDEGYTLNLNYYNYSPSRPVPAKIIVANGHDDLSKNYMVDPNDIIASMPIVVEEQQNCLGVVTRKDDQLAFLLTNTATGRRISSRVGWVQTGLRTALVDQAVNSVRLSHLLELAGAKVVREVVRTPYIDLSPSAMDKTTILDLIDLRAEGR